MIKFKFDKKANEDDYCIFDLAKESKYSKSGVVNAYDLDLVSILKQQHGAEIEKLLQEYDGIFWNGLEVKSWEGQIKWNPNIEIYDYGVEINHPYCYSSDIPVVSCIVSIWTYNMNKWDSGEEYEDEADEFEFELKLNLKNVEANFLNDTLNVGYVYAPSGLRINADLSAVLEF